MNKPLHTIYIICRNFITSLLICFFLFSSHTVFAQFDGDFEPANWTFSTENADGSIDLSQIPNAIVITGGNDENEGNTDYTIPITQDGDIKFSWTYFSTDVDGASYDPGGYVLNGVFTPLVDTGGPPNQNGTASITVANGDTFGFRVYTEDGVLGPGILTIENFTPFKNATPTLDHLDDLFVGVNESPFTVDLTGISAGISEATQNISITATSSDPAILPDPAVTYTSPDATGSLLLSPATDAFGTVAITVTVSDDGGTANGAVDNIVKTFEVNLNSNFPPEMDGLNNLVLAINSTEQSLNLTGINAGKNTSESQTITISASSSNEALIANNNISVDYVSPANNGTLRFTPNADVTGQTTITVTVMDDGGTDNNGNDTFTTSFVVKVNANQLPGINDISDVRLAVNASEHTVFIDGISDGDGGIQNISISATSDNPALIPDPTVTYTSPDATGDLKFTPVDDQFGVANITVTVQDDGGTVDGGLSMITKTFKVEVSGNFAPTLDALNNMILPVNSGAQTINLAGISPGIGETQTLTVTAVSDNTGVIPNPTVTYTSSDPTGTIDFIPETDASGTAEITVTVTDDGGTDNGGIDAFSQTFTVQVAANLPPTIDALNDLAIIRNSGEQTINLFGIGAGNGETQDLSVEVSSDNPSLVADFNLTYTPNDATGSFTFTPVADQVGIANITVAVTDNGGTDNNGIDSTSETFELSVNNFINFSASTTDGPIFDRPEAGTPPFSTVGADFPYYVQPFAVTESGQYTLSVINANFNPFLALYETSFGPFSPLSNVLNSNDDDFAGNLGIFPSLNQELIAGKQYFMVVTSSNALESGNFTAQIAGPGDINLGTVPTLNFLEDVVIEEDGSATVNLSGITNGLGDSQTVTVDAVTDNGDLFSVIAVEHDGTETGSFILSPLSNANGEASVTVTVNNNGIDFERNFLVTVNPVNDAPDFTLDQTDVAANQEFDQEITINVVPGTVPTDENDQTPTYSIDPPSSDLVNVQIDQNTGAVSITSSVGAFGTETFTITANDQQSENNTATQSFTINVNALPTDMALSNDLIEEDVAVGTEVGTLTTTDPDDTEGFTYSLVSGEGDDHNADFTIDNGVLKTNNTFNVSEITEFSVRVRTEDNEGGGFEKAFTVRVDDVTGIQDALLSKATKIWPNPGNGKFHLSLELPTLMNLEVFVTDLAGRIVQQQYIAPRSTTVRTDIELNNMQTGLYLLRIQTEDGRRLTKKIMKE
ncbi:T9SS type A sorting domain-containing protein [Fulvivirgaceae bacterium BMA10]|uniref:T9SS type A sorting domain-containing protein n=1 Tax=Splendidivirga corallicola TaxID=3051826 RepID=A0ABT8KR71_9BACT|nr:T9SS type A sorting domain-containing protein [Fulvivirgaceae bacterium BMA10]